MKKSDRLKWILAFVLFGFQASGVAAQGSSICLESDLDAAVSEAATAGSCNPDGAFIGASGLAAQIVSYAQSQKNKGRCQSALAKSKAAVLQASKVYVAIGTWTADNQYALYNALKREQLGDVCAALPGRQGDGKDNNEGKPNPDQTPQPTPTPQSTPAQGLTAQFNTAVHQACCSNGQKVPEFGGCLIGTNGVLPQFLKAHENDPIINQFRDAIMAHLNKFVSDYQCS